MPEERDSNLHSTIKYVMNKICVDVAQQEGQG